MIDNNIMKCIKALLKTGRLTIDTVEKIFEHEYISKETYEELKNIINNRNNIL